MHENQMWQTKSHYRRGEHVVLFGRSFICLVEHDSNVFGSDMFDNHYWHQCCCPAFQKWWWTTCAMHDSPYDCDALIIHDKRGFGIVIHDSGSSIATIAYCPFCGTRLKRPVHPAGTRCNVEDDAA